MMLTILRAVAGLLALALIGTAHAAEPYRTEGDCDGFPKLDLKTAPGLCVGLVAEHLGFARGVAAVGADIYVLDMGGWRKGKGRLLHLGDRGHAAATVSLSGLDEPSAILALPDGRLLVGELGQVSVLDPRQTPLALEKVASGLPRDGLHPLSALALTADGTLFLNSGSASDHCEHADGSPPDPHLPCPETLLPLPRAALFSLPLAGGDAVPFARGLRNSMALALLPGGQLVAAVNARDAINRADPALSDETLPHDTLVLVKKGADYGWPYCFDDNRRSPEYPDFDCGSREKPTLLLPAHAAPLGMVFYRDQRLPGLKAHLIIAYHGYRENGHRIVALAVGADGSLQGAPREIVGGWAREAGHHPQGAPVALAVMEDGSLLVTEDHNQTLLRVSVER
ncbi:MAG TPA: glucose dehydrogenase [Stellaceae bacterium]|nr:glucose dehydrogenase [Stellaceae bacterium]